MAEQIAELKDISNRLKRLEAEMQKINRMLGQKGIKPGEKIPVKFLTKEQEILSQLFAEGVWRNPTNQELKQAAQWKKLSDTEQQSIITELKKIETKPSLSEIINLNRAGGAIE